MLNRNDPLIGAVQEVMRKNQAERDAVKSVNEKFGVQDRRALPHERQGEWDAAYKKVITEGVVNTAPELEEGKEGDWNKDMKKKQAYVAKKLTPKAKEARDKAAEKIDEEQIDEVLDTPGKRLKYALKSAGSKVKARLTGDTKTADKRTSGLKMAGKKAHDAVEKSKKDSLNNELARDALKKMAHKTGYGALYDKSGLYEEEQIDEISSKLAGNYLKGHHKSVNDPKGITIWKAFKRRDGKKLAVDKLSGTAKVPTKDE